MAKETGLEPLPEQSKRMAIYDEMPAALKKVADDFESKEEKVTRGNLLIRYDMGAKLKEVIAEEAVYGSNAVEQLGKYMGKTDTELYAYRNVAAVYTREEVQAFAERKQANGGHICGST